MLGDIFKLDLDTLVHLNQKEISQIHNSLQKKSQNKSAYTVDNKNSPAFKFTQVLRDPPPVSDQNEVLDDLLCDEEIQLTSQASEESPSDSVLKKREQSEGSIVSEYQVRMFLMMKACSKILTKFDKSLLPGISQLESEPE